MKQILVLGAGRSTTCLVSYFLERAEEQNWFVTVVDKAPQAARRLVGNHPRGDAIAFDVNDGAMRSTLIEKADVVVNMLAPAYQYLIASDCVRHGKHMVSASYQDIHLSNLNLDAHRKGILILTEVGLDPGLDHMSAMSIIQEVKNRGGTVTSFRSYGSALPAPEAAVNPLRYCITWNPRNVAMAGEHGAQFLEDGKTKILPFHQVFQRTWSVELEGIGEFEAYTSGDSLRYQKLFGLEQVGTMIRGTLRYPGWSETWLQIVRLGLPNETLRIVSSSKLAYGDLIEMFLPAQSSGANLEQRVANYLNISPTGRIMENLRWLGLFSSEPISAEVVTAAEALIHLLVKKLQLPPNGRDMAAIVQDFEASYRQGENHREKIRSTLVEFGDPNGFTAMANTVGLSIGIVTKILLSKQLPITGCQIPIHPAIYGPVLSELNTLGIRFKKEVSAY
ncbi:MAG: saccharopine dehydrogenase C-terminal domain-containing protein [Bacteroidota bacterium]